MHIVVVIMRIVNFEHRALLYMRINGYLVNYENKINRCMILKNIVH